MNFSVLCRLTWVRKWEDAAVLYCRYQSHICFDLNIVIQNSQEAEFFTEYGEASRYQIQEVIGKGSYGVVASAVDTKTGERVAIKKINDVFEHVSDATRILREIKLLRLLRHPDIVEIKHIMLPPSRREFKDIYVVFELMESDLHQVIKANDDLTPEHYQFFLYQLMRGLKYTHTGLFFIQVETFSLTSLCNGEANFSSGPLNSKRFPSRFKAEEYSC